MTVDEGSLRPGLAVELAVDHERRTAIRANHSATHLLHEALRQVLGDHVAQKGSLRAPDRLRFDFAHPKPISDGELARVEDIANRIALQNAPVITRLMGVEDAIASGARALFGEKYGDEVRVVSMGVEPGGANAGRPFSIDCAAATHVSRTGDIGLVSIVSEGAVAAGVRRLEAKTADAARHHLDGEARRLREVATLLKAPADDAPERLAAVIEDRRRLERDLSDARRSSPWAAPTRAKTMTSSKSPASIIPPRGRWRRYEGFEISRRAGKDKIGSGIVAIANKSADGKGGVVVAVTADLTSRFNAVDLVRIASEKSAARAAAVGPTWRKPADQTATRVRPRWTR